jgi:hypothetical protein
VKIIAGDRLRQVSWSVHSTGSTIGGVDGLAGLLER